MGTVCFVHIPKTAGSTMLGLLARHYDADRTVRFDPMDIKGSLEHWRALTKEDRDNTALLMGHTVLSVPELPSDTRYITFLREPYDQFISSYYYIRRATWNRYHEKVKAMNGLDQFLEFCVTRNLDNPQVRHLSGCLNAMWAPDGHEVQMSVDDQLFQKAKGWVHRIEHIGLTEHFDASIMMMRQGLFWKRHCYYQVQNKTVSRPSKPTDPVLRSAFDQAYVWDLELYRIAQKRFQAKLKTQGKDFTAGLLRFQEWNRMAQRLDRMIPFMR